MAVLRLALAAAAVVLLAAVAQAQYQPNWESLDSRPTPQWFIDAKFGIFIHWSLFSVPSYCKLGDICEWYQQRLITGMDGGFVQEFHNRTYGPNFSYANFASMFKAELWDPNQWVDLFKKAGAKFVHFTSKHCDGWTHWRSSAKPNYNSVDAGPMRDIVGELTNATRAAGLRMGLYYCNIEWSNPLLPWNHYNGPVPYGMDNAAPYAEQVFTQELKELVTLYKPDIVSGDYQVLLNSSELRSPEFLAWLFNDSPVKDEVVIDDRWGWDTPCTHGGYFTCTDRYQPGQKPNYLWGDWMTIGTSWGLSRNENVEDYKSGQDLVNILVNNVAFGGVLILNVGPAGDGHIIPLQQERLLQVGSWLAVNGDAIYNTTTFKTQQNYTENIYFTDRPDLGVGYAILINGVYPQGSDLFYQGGPIPKNGTKVTMLGGPNIPYTLNGKGGVTLHLPETALPCDYAWSFRVQYA